MCQFNIGVIQMHIEDDKNKNLETAYNFIKEACLLNVDIVVLPEMFSCPYDTSKFSKYAEKDNGHTYTYLSSIAKEFSVYLVGGSIPEVDDLGNIYNTSYVFDRSGKEIGKYRKMHLFDIQFSNSNYFRESDVLSSGDEFCVFDTEFGKIGLAICYDFRFIELARTLVDMGAKAIIVPAGFNMTTGPAHWELMFKSRAVDNQVYTIACSPSRNSSNSYVAYGHSLVVSPWGDIVNNIDEKEGFFIATLDFDYVDKIRNKLPLLKHRRKDIYSINIF